MECPLRSKNRANPNSRVSDAGNVPPEAILGLEGSCAWNDRLLCALGARAAAASLSTLRLHQADFWWLNWNVMQSFDQRKTPGNLQCEERAGGLELDREIVSEALIRPLRSVSALDDQDVRAVRSLPYTVRGYPANQPIVRDGDTPSECCLIMEGFCLRSKATVHGHTQILSFHIPGDIPDLESGKSNKAIASVLVSTVRTIKAHRHRVMEKMQARSVAELVSL
jgi:hypothetical protein